MSRHHRNRYMSPLTGAVVGIMSSLIMQQCKRQSVPVWTTPTPRLDHDRPKQ